jgi:hypothetical protein
MQKLSSFLLLLLMAAAAMAAPQLVRAAPAAADQQPLVCVVVRTYYAHGTYGDSSLMNLLHSLKQQSHQRCGFVAEGAARGSP